MRVLHQYSNIPALSLKRKLTAAKWNLSSSRYAFATLDTTVPEDIHDIWKAQESKALVERLSNPTAMDIFEVQLEKGMSSCNKYRTRLTSHGKHQVLNPWRLAS